MSKPVLFGIAAFGGIVLIAVLLGLRTSDPQAVAPLDTESQEVTRLPDGIPLFPIYDAEVTNVRDALGSDSRDISVSLRAPETMADIHAWYREALSKDGWRITSDKNVAGYQIIQAEKENLYTSLQTARGEADTVIISQHLKIRQ